MSSSQDRDRTGRFVKTLESAERDRDAVRLRSRGLTYREIADKLGYSDPQNARRAVTAVLEAIPLEARDEAVRLQLDHLDMLTTATIKVLERWHYTVSDGRIVYLGDPDDPGREPLMDDGPVLQAVDRLLKIADRRAKLLGLDAPRRVEVSDGSVSDLDRAVQDLAAELAAAGAGRQVPPEP